MRSGLLLAGRYALEARLGGGGAGETYRAHDELTDRPVALKVVRRASAASLEVLRSEFLALRGLRHPNLTEVLDFGRQPSVGAFYTSQLLEGTDLLAWARGRPWSELAPALVGLVRALAFLHARGTVHGDVTPKNVLVSNAGHPTLIDLSCSRRAGSASDEVSGTRDFIAPELWRGEPITPLADLFALGVTLQLVSGVARADAARLLAPLVQRLTAAESRARPSSAEEVMDLLGAPALPLAAGNTLRSDLVGRDDALATFDTFLDAFAARSAAPRIVHLRGKDGSGRTRLFEELKWRAQERVVAIEGRARGRTRGVLEMLTRALGRAPSPGASTAALVELCEELSDRAEPIVLALDDAHRLSSGELFQLGAVARSLRSSGVVALLTTGDTPFPVTDSGAVIEIGVEPLSRVQVASWVGDAASTAALEAIMRSTGGYPKAVASLLSRAGTAMTATFVESAARAIDAGEAGTVDDPLEQQILANIVVHGEAGVSTAPVSGRGAFSDQRGGALIESDEPALTALARRGVIRRDADGWVLAVSPSAARAALPAAVLAGAHRAAADEIMSSLGGAIPDVIGREHGEAVAELLLHRVCAADEEALLDLVARARPIMLRLPSVFRRPCAALVERTLRPAAIATAATILERCGDAVPGLSAIVRAMRRRPPPSERGPLRHAAAACYARLGDVVRSERYLRRVLDDDSAPERARAAADLSLALLRRGRHAEAVAVATKGLDADGRGAREALIDLACNLAMGLEYGGDHQGACAEIARAIALTEASAPAALDPRALYRVAATRALLAFRTGDAEAAALAYDASLEIAERHGLDDAIASAALNTGTTRHQLGDWGSALAAYERGLRIAIALGDTPARMLLELNLAKLYVDVGQFDRADARIARLRTRADVERMDFLAGALDAIAAESALARSALEEAERLLDSATSRLDERGARRELVEVGIQRAELDLQRGLVDDAALSELEVRAREIGAADAAVRARFVRGLAHSRRGNTRAAVAALESAAREADETRQLSLRAEVEAALGDAYAAAGGATLAAHHRTRARKHWDRVLTSLPAELQPAFRLHPKRFGMYEPAAPVAAPTSHASSIEVLRAQRLLEINRRLNSAHTAKEVLEATMDAAIELSQAERGFLLVSQDGSLQVSVARNVDRERIARPQLKFSRTIAERAIERGEPVLATNAESDTRFGSNASVHALRLKSVLCVPIRSPEGTLGAIYLDNRFRAGSFRDEEVEMLLAFSDQAAIALVRSRMHDELLRRTAELEKERARIEQLLAEQADEIVRLQSRLTVPSAPRRHDYSAIVGSSPAMQRVFDVLDRIITADVTVLISGESGTGKELAARAIHDNSDRRGGPFVALNCAALPETLLEAELFGYRRGAFTGATRDHPGLFSSAEKGTLFLDELGDMPASVQVKLLRVLQQREVLALGATQPLPIDVRVLGATHRVLRDDVAAGRFREDLYYRVAVVEVVLPPLRERIEDIPALTNAILLRLSKTSRRPPPMIDRAAERALLEHAWPGNVRELENVLTKASLLCEGGVIRKTDLDFERRIVRGHRPAEVARITAALEATGWNVAESARALGMSRPTFYRKLRRYGIWRPAVVDQGFTLPTD